MAKQTKAEAVKEIERAERALEAAKAKHRAEFRKVVFAVYEAYGLKLKAVVGQHGTNTGSMQIETLTTETLDQAVPQ